MIKPLSIYPALPYTDDPKKSFKLASFQTLQLRRLGFFPFSPVNHTHNYRLEIRENYCPKCFRREKFYERVDGRYHCQYCKVNFPKSELITDDYYGWDLHLLKGLMAHDIEWCENEDCGIYSHECRADNKCIGCIIEFTQRKYDSGVVMMMSETAYEFNKFGGIRSLYDSWKEGLINEEDWESYWHSKGCRLEYEFAIKNHILVIKTEMFILRTKQYVKNNIEYHGWDLINYIIKEYPEVVLS